MPSSKIPPLFPPYTHKISETTRTIVRLMPKQAQKKSYNPLKIKQYIGWLRIYDEIVKFLEEKNGADNLCIENGAVIIPDGSIFRYVLLNDNTPSDQGFESRRKFYKKAYEESKIMIQTTPNLNFTPSRTDNP